jgi:hypothetical protein
MQLVGCNMWYRQQATILCQESHQQWHDAMKSRFEGGQYILPSGLAAIRALRVAHWCVLDISGYTPHGLTLYVLLWVSLVG